MDETRSSARPMSDDAAPTGEAVIEHVFRITGRGLVLMLGEHFTGNVHRPGRVESERGICPYYGPDFIRRTDGGSSIGILVSDPRAEELFRPGDTVRFYKAG
jgi:hypothetical protein